MKPPLRITLTVFQAAFLLLGAILVLWIVITAITEKNDFEWDKEAEIIALAALASILLGIGFSPVMWGGNRPVVATSAPHLSPQMPASAPMAGPPIGHRPDVYGGRPPQSPQASVYGSPPPNDRHRPDHDHR